MRKHKGVLIYPEEEQEAPNRYQMLKSEVVSINETLNTKPKPIGYKRTKLLSRRYTCLFELRKLEGQE